MKKHWYFFLLIIISAGFSLWAYPQLPEKVPIHWNFSGEVDGYSSKLFAVFATPVLMMLIYGILMGVPKIDPRKDNFQKFEGVYRIFVNVTLTFFGAGHLSIIFSGLGYHVNIDWIANIGLGLLFIILGNYMPKIKANYFIGIRTPWTMANETVWARTHRFGGKVFFIGGIIIIVSAFAPSSIRAVLLIASIVCIAIVPMVYSYAVYKKVVDKYN
ncbi:SdpI family protein [Saccharococcus caldoxylosilyticus]|uniref:SdpI family protein n=1 Tax=Saccharococcus caldoxylosilyticus TaxID=81408 RepID=UPI001FCADF32|nr:SdpI family protein [Parageobacillus caldoxylosilyticus]BDG43284.1 immunity protein SdpI [Parageobacillus caldoxylosilyticus]